MSCGNCHPLDNALHQNGSVDVELYNPNALAGSLKAQNPLNAVYVPGGTVYTDGDGLSYTLGSCSNVYCHSYNDWTTPGGVPEPWPLNANDPPVPPNTVTTRYYQTPTWGGASLGCSGCHGNPPRTTYFTNAGGAGNSHSWLDDYGYEDLHDWNMSAGYPVDCKTCHNDTVKDPSPYTWLSTYQDPRYQMTWYDVASFGVSSIADHAKHVNGTVDVAFDRAGTYPYFPEYGGPVLDLLNAQYDPSAKSCSNVSCHQQQTTVTWGMPYRFWSSAECNRCHGM
jgi:predicted CxxxxCH...CXXCH cytochrome family protein